MAAPCPSLVAAFYFPVHGISQRYRPSKHFRRIRVYDTFHKDLVCGFLPWRRKGMEQKAFIKKLAVFGVLFIFLSALANQVHIRLVLSHSLQFQMDEQFDLKKNSVSILVAGDSHPQRDIDPEFLPGSFVVATSGENITQTYYRLRYYLEREQLNIKLVILPLDLHSFSDFRADRFQHIEYWKKYIDYRELGILKGEPLEFLNYRLRGEFTYINGVQDLIDFAENQNDGENSNKLIDGYLPQSGKTLTESPDGEVLEERLQRHFLNRQVLYPESVDYLLRIIELLRNHDVQLALVRFPVPEIYYNGAKDYIDVDAYYARIDQILLANGYTMPVLDYHDLFSRHMEYFYDIDHLNTAGAVEFTKILFKDLEKLGYLN
jgi:hypothetical protein